MPPISKASTPAPVAKKPVQLAKPPPPPKAAVLAPVKWAAPAAAPAKVSAPQETPATTLESLGTAAASLQPKIGSVKAAPILSALGSGNATIDVPIKAGDYKVKGVPFTVKPGTVARVNVQVKNGELVSVGKGQKGTSVKIDPPLDLPLWFTAKGVELKGEDAKQKFEAELGGFLVDPTVKREMWEEGLRVALRCMSEAPFTGHAGEYVTMPPRNVVPKPMQRPHPPVWVACSRRDTILLAAQKGIGALAFAFVDPEEAQQWVADYHRTMAAEGVPIGDAVNSEVACVTTFMCHEDEETAIARGLAGANFFGYSLAHYYLFGRHQPGSTDVWAEYQARRADQGYSPEAVEAARSAGDRLGAKVVEQGTTGLRGAIGTPDQIREYLRRYEECGVDQVILCSQSGRNRHEDIMESLELFGREVMPEFADRDEQRVRDKAARLEPIIEQVLARKPASDHPPLPDGYEMPAMPRAMADASGSDDVNTWLDEFADEAAIDAAGKFQGLI